MIGGIAAALLAIDPAGLGGLILCGSASPQREELVRQIGRFWPDDADRRRIPVGTTEDRLFGSLDLSATVSLGTPVYQPGLLAEMKAGLLTLPSAERASESVVAGLRELLDAARPIAILALDESLPDESGIPAALRERMAFQLPFSNDPIDLDEFPPDAIERARARIGSFQVGDREIAAICQTALALGVGSARAELMSLKAAVAHAALDGRIAIEENDLAVAASLVLAPRATRVPPAPAEPPPPPEQQDSTEAGPQSESQGIDRMPDRILAAARAALPAELLASAVTGAGKTGGKGGAQGRNLIRGRRIGVCPGDPRRGARLDLVDTLRAAAPWQRLRRGPAGRLKVRKTDFRIQRRINKSGTTVIIAVDASGSSALQRLAEAKGAIELLLADSYVRRDRVALLSFRGVTAELVLPPTRSLARARRTLTGLPGGGGTPLASALLAGEQLARQVMRDQREGSALFVILTDARANVSLSGAGGRSQAETDARSAARAFRSSGIPSILIDTSPRPSPFAAELAGLMGGRCLPLPTADASNVCRAVRSARPAEPATR